MLFSISYKSKHKDKADEIKCPVNQLGLIIKSHSGKRLNIILNELTDKAKEQIDMVSSITNNYTIECARIVDLRQLRSEDRPSYLKYPVTDWETFDNLVQMGVSDIYIDGPLCFQGEALALAREKVKIRVSPTVSANAAISTDKYNANTFFIRPEDLSIYESAIDIIDFNTPDQDIEDTLFKIYKRGSFSYDISQLVKHVHCDVPNPIITSKFAEVRFNCGQKCKAPDHSCELCTAQLSLAKDLFAYFKRNH